MVLNAVIRVQTNFSRTARRIDRTVDSSNLYILGAIRRNARRGIKKGSKSKPHSEPGRPANSRTGILKNTIKRSYDKRSKVGLCGPDNSHKSRRRGQRPASQTVPEMLEFSGRIIANKTTYIPVSRVSKKYANIDFQKKRSAARARGRRFLRRDHKFVALPKGTRRVAPRPTMRIGLRKTLTAPNLRRAFARIGVNPTRFLGG